MAVIAIKPKNRNTRFVALAAGDRGRILVEGVKASSVVRRAQATGRAFSMVYVPRKNETHVLHRVMR